MQLHLDLDNSAEKADLIEQIKGLRGRWRMELVRERSRKRTNLQNRWYHHVVEIFADYLRDCGCHPTHDQVHEIFKKMFLTRAVIINEETGETLDMVGSTATLSTVEFIDYLDEICAYLEQEHGLIVPEPSRYRTIETETTT